MHSHWYSASPDVQHGLIYLYILSLASKSTSTTLSTSSKSNVNSELQYTRSSHDIVAVFHLVGVSDISDWGLEGSLHHRMDGAVLTVFALIASVIEYWELLFK